MRGSKCIKRVLFNCVNLYKEETAITGDDVANSEVLTAHIDSMSGFSWQLGMFNKQFSASLISNFRRVLNVVYFILDISPASD
jgi:hypothetical protein